MDSARSISSRSPDLRQPARVCVAAIGDLHVRGLGRGEKVPGLQNLAGVADLLLVAGDLTENGRLTEAEAAAEILQRANIPVIAVLGNHDLRSLRRTAFRRLLERHGIAVLEGGAITVRLPQGIRLGVAGVTGSGGGFWPVAGPCGIPARTLKRLAIRARREGEALAAALQNLDVDIRVVAMHFAPTTTTLGSEPLAKYWMLGNSELGEVIDRHRPDIVIHGHAHLGTLHGRTTGGVPVRNVALPVVGGIHFETLEIPRGAVDASAATNDTRVWL